MMNDVKTHTDYTMFHHLLWYTFFVLHESRIYIAPLPSLSPNYKIQMFIYNKTNVWHIIFCTMANFSEKTDMVLIFGERHQNSRNAEALYAERYPERYHPPHNYF